ncbi:MAG: FHA domain-containing protein [Burkholderiales bacterium]|nr:FHA domain-containing protein [Burkholderiales bacterium]
MDMSGKPTAEPFLAQIDRLIDLRPFSLLIGAIGARMHAEVPAGVVKMLLLARWYGMGEAALLEACQDRISFRRFLGLALEGSSEDVRLAESYRNAAQFPMEGQNLIHAVEAQLLAKGFSVRPGMWAEASIVPVTEGIVMGGDTSGELDFSGAPDGGRIPQAAREPAAPPAAALVETRIFQPGELKELADTGESALVRGVAKMTATAAPVQSGPVELVPPAGPEVPAPSACVEWASGSTTEFSGELNIGRDQRFCPNAVELKADHHVSRRHAVLSVCAEGVWVRDLGSRNGTFVDGDALPQGQAVLVDSDASIRFGPHCAVRLKVCR